MKALFRLPLVALTALAASLPAQTTVPASGAPAAAGTFMQLKRGDVAPEFSVTNPKGDTIKLSDYRGKIVIVDVSATWCGPCQAAMPNNDRVYQKYADQGVVLLGITADDSRAAYDGWIERNASKYKFSMFFDPAGKDGWKDSVFNTQYHVTGFPAMFVIGRDGKISETVSGGGPGEDYRLEYALARAGAKVDLAAIPPEPKKDPNAPKSIPAVAKTAAMPAMGMAAPASASGGFTPDKFGSVARGAVVPDFTVTGADGQPVKLSSFRGKTLLLQFNTGNGPQPWFAKIAAAYQEQGLAALAVFSATEREAFDKWVAANPNPGFAVAWDPAGKAWAENATNTIFGVGMYPATAVIKSDGTLWSGTIGMGDKVVAMVYSMLARNGIKLAREHTQALVAAGGAVAMGGGGAVPAANITPRPAAAAPAARPPLLAKGEVAPNFTMLDVNGREVKLSDFSGKIVVLDFWATWCGPCIASFPHTQKIAARYKDQDVVVLASGTSDTIEAFKKWIPANQPKYPDMRFVFDRNERGSATFEQRASAHLYNVSAIPTQFVIGRDGKVVASIVGNGGESDPRTEGALALAGVKVDEAIATKGKAALSKAADDEKKAEAARAEAAKNPPPPFHEDLGKLKAGEPLADFALGAADGHATKFSAYAKGKVTVIGLWSASNGPPSAMLATWDAWAKRYAGQNVVFLGIGGYDTREAFDQWREKNAGKFSFPVALDPAGKFTPATKKRDEMTPDEVKAESARQRDHYAKVISSQLGGVVTPIPTTIVADAAGKLVGWSAGFGPVYADALGNLLHRAGVKLSPEDVPAKIFTAEETKTKPPAATAARPTLIAVGAAAPDFTTTDVAGKPVKISDYRGKVVILDFWATWCGPCINSMPHTQQVAAHFKDQGVVVLASCTSDNRAAFEKWVAQNQSKFPDMLFSHDAAERGPDRASAKLYGVSGIPQQVIIGRDGKVAALVTGYLAGEVILEGALAQAGLKVDPAIVAKAKTDLAKRVH